MMNIGIVCEGPTDYTILKEVVDRITGESNDYVQLQPEADLTGAYGNGWKGVWKWCRDNADQKDKLMKEVEPSLDFLIIQMDGDVSRKEAVTHCLCKTTECEYKGQYHPMECDGKKEIREMCPIVLPCADHEMSVNAYISHVEKLIGAELKNLSDTCIVIPCDSTESWIVAAYDEVEYAEEVEDPWKNIIAKKKAYHEIRIPGKQKRIKTFKEFAQVVGRNWEKVTELCVSARVFEKQIMSILG